MCVRRRRSNACHFVRMSCLACCSTTHFVSSPRCDRRRRRNKVGRMHSSIQRTYSKRRTRTYAARWPVRVCEQSTLYMRDWHLHDILCTRRSAPSHLRILVHVCRQQSGSSFRGAREHKCSGALCHTVASLVRDKIQRRLPIRSKMSHTIHHLKVGEMLHT